ncbi:MAG: DUF2905 domain-containing protein [bacterium]
MDEFVSLGKLLVILGILLVVVGVLIVFGAKIPLVGKLPGDIHIKKGNFDLYFPVATCIVISLILTLLFYLIHKIR